MSTKVIINPKTGMGQPINPYPRIITPLDMSGHHDERNQKWIDFEKENPALPVITAAGETLTDGRYECEKVWQYYDDYKFPADWLPLTNEVNEMAFDTREVWKVIETPELPGKETVEEAAQVIYPIEMAMNVESFHSIKNWDINEDRHLYTALTHKK